MQLPVLVAHGVLVGTLALAGLVGATFGVRRALRAAAARRQARAARDLLAKEATAPRAGAGVVRGRITAGSVATTAGPTTATLTLDCDGALVEVEGPILVEHGALERVRWQRHTRSVGPGTEVLAAGVLEEQTGEATSYRETPIRWRLSGDRLIRIIATAPRPKPVPLRPGQLIATIAVATPLWLGVLHLTGRAALSIAEKHERASARDGDLSAFGATQVAAAMPGTRADALRQLGDDLADFDGPVTERALDALVELSELRGRCPVDVLARVVRLEPALAAARQCGTRDDVAKMLAFLGRYAEAEHELAPGDTSWLATTIHLATGNWSLAVPGIEARADEIDHRDFTHDPETEAVRTEESAKLRCLAALVRSYAGDHDAFAHVQRGKGNGCAILEAAALPVGEQSAAFAKIPEHDADPLGSGYALIADELAFAAGPARSPYFHSDASSALVFQFTRSTVWFAPFQVATHPDDPIAHANMTAVAVFRGDLAQARAELARASTDPYAGEQLALAVALRSPEPIAATSKEHPGLEDALALRHGESPAVIERYMDTSERFDALIRRAASGDGEALALALEDGHVPWSAFALPMLGLLPRITTHREAAAAALRLFRNDLTTFDANHLPFGAISDMALYRDAARLAGDTDDARQWQAIIDRHAAVIADRQRLTALQFRED